MRKEKRKELKTVSGIMLTLLLIGMLTLEFNIQPVKAGGTIYIRADGSVDPPTVNITSVDNVTYTFTGNIYDEIVVERSNIVVDGNGYKLQGSGNGYGVDLSGVTNVTLRNASIENFSIAIYLSSSSDNVVSEINITNNEGDGISLLESSSNNIFFENNITSNEENGIYLDSSSHNNTFFRNNITNNYFGVLVGSSDNEFYHNNFIDNIQQVSILTPGCANFWDNGYPLGGNYWGDYDGTDLYKGPGQNETGSDGIGDIPYDIDEDNKDRYPFMIPYQGIHAVAVKDVRPSKTILGQDFTIEIHVDIANLGDFIETFNVTVYANTTIIDTLVDITLTSGNATTVTRMWNTTDVAKGNYTITAYAEPVPGETDLTDNNFTNGWILVTVPGDVNGDCICDMADISMMIEAFMTYPGDPKWDPNCDINCDDVVDMADISIAIDNFMKTCQDP